MRWDFCIPDTNVPAVKYLRDGLNIKKYFFTNLVLG